MGFDLCIRITRAVELRVKNNGNWYITCSVRIYAAIYVRIISEKRVRTKRRLLFAG